MQIVVDLFQFSCPTINKTSAVYYCLIQTLSTVCNILHRCLFFHKLSARVYRAIIWLAVTSSCIVVKVAEEYVDNLQAHSQFALRWSVVFYLLMKSKKWTWLNLTPTNSHLPAACQSTPGLPLRFRLTSDGHYYLPDGNNNFNVFLMIVIMLGTHSPDSVLIARRRPQQGARELTSEVWFTSQWSAGHCSTCGRLSSSRWTSPLLIL